uniref:Retrovirus-related Pol polyprotein from transposon TNT 1-94 n=1 Tax=Tanacetum cinerariifolium TaxID=118510 RepID=A0A6L2JYV4_TANCI|nr:retrovirus-related Pol polyprotein from transposon TNT 1-94 [Tanacetum cinerariifolium]
MEQFQVNTKFLNSLPPELSKFVTDVKLVKDLHTTNFDQLCAYLEQHKLHANEVHLLRERNQDPLALIEDLDTYDSDCDDVSNAKPVLMANISNYDSDVISEKAQQIKPTLYDGIVTFAKHVAMRMIDYEETLIWEEESQSKVFEKENDPEDIKQKNYNKPIDYVKLNKLYEDFRKCFVPQQELLSDKLFAQLQDKDTTICKLKEIIKSMREKSNKKNVNYDYCEIETKNVELKNSVAKLLSENERLCKEINHVKKVFKEKFDSLKKICVCIKKQSDYLIDKLNLKSAENKNLKAQIQDKVFVITSLRNDLQKLHGKEIVDIVAQTPSANTIVLGMFKLDLDPLAPKLLQTRIAHIDYLKYTQEQVDILWVIVEQAKAKHPLDNALDFACRTFTIVGNSCPLTRITLANVVPPKKTTSYSLEIQKPELKVYNKKPKSVKNVGSSKKAKIVKSKNANHLEPNHTWESNATDISPSTSFVTTGCADCSMVSGLWMFETYDREPFSVDELYGVDLLLGSRDTNLYTISLDDMLKTSLICLLYKASKTKSWLWNCQLSHLNFGTLNKLAKDGLARGIPRLKFQKDHMCSACALGKNNGTEFVNQTLHEFYENVGISHQAFVAHTPQQNDVVERRNRTLVEVTRTMLIFFEAPLFFWAEVINTACYTQNRSLIRLRYNKTPYELIQDKKPDLSFFHVFCALCYPTNDNDDLGKLDFKADTGIFVGYALTKKAFRIYNKRTRIIIETIHVKFDELTAMACEQLDSGPGIQFLVTTAPRAVDLADSPVSTSIDQDAPSTSLTSQGSSSNVRPIHTPFESLGRWTKDHPIANVISDPSRSVSTRKQLQIDVVLCYFDAFLTSVEPKNFKQEMIKPSWVNAIREEIHEFKMLQFWELVSCKAYQKALTSDETDLRYLKGTINKGLWYLKDTVEDDEKCIRGQQVALEIIAAHVVRIKGSKDIVGLMLMTMEQEIKQNLDNLHAHEMRQELKTLFAQQVEQELLQTMKGKNKLAYAPKLKTPLPPKREDPAKDSGASGSGIFTIELYTFPNKSRVYDTSCGTHICSTTQGLRGSRKLMPGALSLYVGNGIISVSCLYYDGYLNQFVDNSIQVSRNNMVYFSVIPRDGIFEIDFYNSYTNVSSMYALSNKRSKSNLDSTLFWHCHLRDISKKRIEKLKHDGLLNSTDLRDFEKCVPYTDACGPFKIVSRQGASYFITFTDDFSHYCYVYLFNYKQEVFETFKVFQKEVENQLESEFLENTLITQEASRSLEDLKIIQEEDTHPSINTSLNHKEDDQEINEPQNDIIPIRSKWIFKKKTDMDGAVDTYKARLMVKGYNQTPRINYEETFSPVADIRAIRILIGIAAFYDYEIWKMDVKTAFLNVYLSE